MQWFKRWLIGGTALYSFLLLFMFADRQRAEFGERAASLLSWLELAIPAIAVWLFYLHKAGKRDVAKAGGWFMAGAVVAFMSWFVHPEQIYQRAQARVSDWERVIVEHRLPQQIGTETVYRSPTGEVDASYEPPDTRDEAALRLRRMWEEYLARKWEAEAARVRYTGEPEFFRSTFIVWSLLGIAAAMCGVGAITLLSQRQST